VPPTDICDGCGAEAEVFRDSPLCFDCYVDSVDRVRSCALVRVGDNGEFVVGAPTVDETDAVGHAVADELSAAGIGATVSEVTTLTEARDHIGDYHAREIARGVRSGSRHVYAATSERGTVIDSRTRTDAETRDELADRLARHVVDTSRVKKRADIRDAVAATFPTLAEHRTPARLGVTDRVWSLAKKRGVSRRSRRALNNQRKGRCFEDCFLDWCDERGLRVVYGKTGLVRHHPEAADTVVHKTDGLAGVPDFLVRGDEQRSFGDGWRPDDDAFVEVKRETSALSRDQQTVVAHLKALGFEVFIFRGEPEDHRFERR